MSINKLIEFELSCEIPTTYRTQRACNSLDIDISKKSKHKVKIDNIDLPKDWNIGVIYGNSGSGKTTTAEHIFGKDIFNIYIDENKPIIEQFDKSYTYEQIISMLNSIGLNSVPCWVRPFKTLSNGQKARAEAALKMSSKNNLTVIDEWTSVVDRTVAKVMSKSVRKFVDKHNKQIILLTCHKDILDWLEPDWVIDMNEQKYKGFFLLKKKSSNSTSKKSQKTVGNILASIII